MTHPLAAQIKFVCVQEMVCLEPAVAKTGPQRLEPEATWMASQTLTYSKL